MTAEGESSSETVSIAVIPDNPIIPEGPTISVNFHADDVDALDEHQVVAGETAGFVPVDGASWTNINLGSAAAHNAAEAIFQTVPSSYRSWR